MNKRCDARLSPVPACLALVLIFGPCAAAQQSSALDPRARREFCLARPGYRYEFPRDHFSHPCFRTEWWYFTGNLATPDGRRFGYELTFFREGIDNPYPNPSRWRVDDLYLAHFALTDLGQKKFFYTQRMSRAGVDMAGADIAATPEEQKSADSPAKARSPAEHPQRIWNGAWSAVLQGEAWLLDVVADDRQLQLELVPRKPPAIHGTNGISQKGNAPGNGSHYYSLTRLETSGTLRIAGTSYPLTGWSWMDHEFSTSQLEPDQAGWDWISLQMDDGTDWMFYQFRRRDGSRDPHSAGSLIGKSGSVTPLAAADFQMTPLATWSSPHSGARYPIRWRITVPRLGFQVEVSTALPEQELDTRWSTGVIYWEGSITAQGSSNGMPVRGSGYLEMTGYAGSLPSTLYGPR